MPEDTERIIQLLERYDDLFRSQNEVNTQILRAITSTQERLSKLEVRLQRVIETHNLWDGS